VGLIKLDLGDYELGRAAQGSGFATSTDTVSRSGCTQRVASAQLIRTHPSDAAPSVAPRTGPSSNASQKGTPNSQTAMPTTVLEKWPQLG